MRRLIECIKEAAKRFIKYLKILEIIFIREFVIFECAKWHVIFLFASRELRKW